MNFRAYAEQKGLHLLKDDLIFLRKQFGMLKNEQRRVAMKRYTDVWSDSMESCKDLPKAQNLGRRRANQWLLEFMNKFA